MRWVKAAAVGVVAVVAAVANLKALGAAVAV